MTKTLKVALAAVLCAAVVATTGLAPAGAKPKPKEPKAAFTLTILHNNDGESSLLPVQLVEDGPTYGGAARFFTKVETETAAAEKDNYDAGEARRRSTLLLNSGDNFLAGTAFQASRVEGAPFYDAEFVEALDYDALAVGNHEFDFGPAVFGEFVENVQPARGTTPFVTANLDFGAEPSLAPLVGDELVSSTVLKEKGNEIGVVGLTTPSLPSVSSPGFVEVLADIGAIAQAEIDALTARGVDIVVLQSHLQGLQAELDLVGSLRDVDVVIGGGGDEVLADATTPLVPGDEENIFGEYPQIATDADGVGVPVVTTPGNYRYVGALEVTFDKAGAVIGIDRDDSGIKLVTDTGPAAGAEDPDIKAAIEAPVAAFIAELAATPAAEAAEVLDCARPDVRGMETNCANLIVDAHLATGTEYAAAQGLDTPQLALLNGGGIRGDIDRGPGTISVADTFALQPFGNFVSVVEDVPAEAVRQIIEEGAIILPASGDGGFTHVSDGTTLVIDTSFQPRVADQGTGEQSIPGERVRELVLADGTVVVTGGVTQDVTVDLVQLNFSVTGGDAQPDLTQIPGVTFTQAPVSDQQSLQRYLQDDLGGVISPVQYPRGGEGRITID